MIIPDRIDAFLAEKLSERGIFLAELSKNFDKPGLIVAHNRVAQEFKQLLQDSRFLETQFSHLVKDPLEPSAPLSSLQREKSIPAVRRRQCENPTSGGVYVVGKFCVKPFMTGGVRTIFEDNRGNAVLVVIDNSLCPTASGVDVWNKYPEGMEVAIKEPQLEELWNDGTIGWRVGNPADIVPIHERNLLDNAAEIYKSAKNTSRHVSMVDCAEQLRVQGNIRFAQGEWSRAATLYTVSAQILERILRTYRAPDEMKHKLMTIYGNNVESCLRSGSYKKALKSANQLLALSPNEEKASVQRARSLCGMHRYKEAIFYLDVLQAGTSDEDILNCISATKVSVATASLQSRSGIYKFDDFVDVFNETKEAPECSQYIGPVEIRKTNCGRGMFTTRDVRPGELLLVSKALARPEGSRAAQGRTYHGAGLVYYGLHRADQPVDTWSSEWQDVIVQMIEKAQKSPQYARQVKTLQHGSQAQQDVPPLSLFTEDWDDDDNRDLVTNPEREEEHLENIQIGNFRAVQEANLIADVLYGSASFFNHSCTPNCMNYPVGDYLFVSSSRAVGAGEELFINYFNISNSLLFREREASPLFLCECPRCKFEEQVLHNIPTLQALVQEYHEKFETCDMKTAPRAQNFLAVLESILEMNPYVPLSKQEKDWIRCSFSQAYVLLCCHKISKGDLSTVDVTLQILASVDPGNPCILALLAMSHEEELDGVGWAGGNHFRDLLEAKSKEIYLPVEEKHFDLVVQWAEICKVSLIRLLL